MERAAIEKFCIVAPGRITGEMVHEAPPLGVHQTRGREVSFTISSWGSSEEKIGLSGTCNTVREFQVLIDLTKDQLEFLLAVVSLNDESDIETMEEDIITFRILAPGNIAGEIIHGASPMEADQTKGNEAVLTIGTWDSEEETVRLNLNCFTVPEFWVIVELTKKQLQFLLDAVSFIKEDFKK